MIKTPADKNNYLANFKIFKLMYIHILFCEDWISNKN